MRPCFTVFGVSANLKSVALTWTVVACMADVRAVAAPAPTSASESDARTASEYLFISSYLLLEDRKLRSRIAAGRPQAASAARTIARALPRSRSDDATLLRDVSARDRGVVRTREGAARCCVQRSERMSRIHHRSFQRVLSLALLGLVVLLMVARVVASTHH
jgi:hypothetical protein